VDDGHLFGVRASDYLQHMHVLGSVATVQVDSCR
jgi:hypothetical protein